MILNVIETACNITVGSYKNGELDNCQYLMENTRYSLSSIGLDGYWLENTKSLSATNIWLISGYYRSVSSYIVSDVSRSGVRPAIEVLESNILY